MRILQIIQNCERGGVQKLAAMIEDWMSPLAFETAYLYPHQTSIFAKPIHVLRMARHIWRGKYDAIIAYQTVPNILIGFVGALSGCRLRVAHQTSTPDQIARPLRLLDEFVGTLGFYSANVISNVDIWRNFARYPSHYRRSMVLIEPGLEAPTPNRNREQTRREFCLPQTYPILLHVGRLITQKNQDVLVRALACLPQAHLVLVGAGDKESELHSLAVTLGIDDRLHMLGTLPTGDIADLYAAADLFVFPSTSETSGLASIEAALANMPMVVADLPLLHEIFRTDGSEPITYVAPNNVEGWISAIGETIASPPSTQMLRKFAAEIARKFSRQRAIENYLSLFQAHHLRYENELNSAEPPTEQVFRP